MTSAPEMTTTNEADEKVVAVEVREKNSTDTPSLDSLAQNDAPHDPKTAIHPEFAS